MKQIPLTQNKFAIVDDNDFEFLSKFKWAYHNGYATRKETIGHRKYITVFMHRKILGLQFGDKRFCDHKNLNRLDNRRDNLRICDRSENTINCKLLSSNTSGYKGVHFLKKLNKWRAVIWKNGKSKHLGFFKNQEDAYAEYCVAANILHKDFCRI